IRFQCVGHEYLGQGIHLRVTTFGGGSMMKWAGISLTGKTRLVITESNLNGERHQDEILQSLSADLT
uniref:Uncharacterized protein n=1 Tax=Neolamprologus brichardi TaxID=32507 RepID=A0A3Q4GRG9_NEOBR